MNRRRSDHRPRFVPRGRTWVLAQPELDAVCARVLRRGPEMGPALVNGPQAFDLAGRHISPPSAGGASHARGVAVSADPPGRAHVSARGAVEALEEAA